MIFCVNIKALYFKVSLEGCSSHPVLVTEVISEHKLSDMFLNAVCLTDLQTLTQTTLAITTMKHFSIATSQYFLWI